ncbi:helix-turn-helix transcriptional regulator [Yeosuana marina]|uniref:helix-turn-helix transcriptional regulator n=1 Tax=Yeosuana marina TaxID=1565536 RepID=UPI0030C8A708
MKKDWEEAIKISIAISLNKLLEIRKVALNQPIENVAKSYNKIALDADIRKATVSDTFNGKTMPSASTLILIVEKMGFKLTDFSEIYCSIKEEEVRDFLLKSKKKSNP